MKISEMENFSVDELQNFTIRELEIKTKKLLKKAQKDNRQLPLPIIEKLQILTNSLPKSVPKVKSQMTISDGCDLIQTIIVVLTSLPVIAKIYAPMVQEIIEMIEHFINQL